MGKTRIATLRVIAGVGYTVDKIIDVKEPIKLNVQDGDIGKLGTRRVTHSNTFNIELTEYNMNTLGLNIYNLDDLSLSMSTKIRCRLLDDYYSKEGYLLVSNVDRKSNKIACIFTDANLEILDQWSLYSYAAYLLNPLATLPTDYNNALLELKVFMDKNLSMAAIGQGAQAAAVWPTNFNSVGDEFNTDGSGNRIVADSLNVFQTRPAFNIKFFLDFMAYGFDYTPVYTSSVNVSRLEGSYIVNDGATDKEVIPAITPGSTAIATRIINYDDYGQYEHFKDAYLGAEAPSNISAKGLLTSILKQQGLLCHIDEEEKKITYYSYSDYADNYAINNFQDWTAYLVNKDRPVYNSDFGQEFGRSNIIGLKDPFPGNTFNYTFDTQGTLSRYEASVSNLSDKFSDITGIDSVNIGGTYPYFEYKHKDLCIIELSGTIAAGNLDQYYIGVSTPNKTGLVYKISNFNYATIPDGLTSWYNTVENGVKISAQFLLPQIVINDFEILLPVRVGGLFGVFAVNKIKEYVDGFTPVTVELIKVI